MICRTCHPVARGGICFFECPRTSDSETHVPSKHKRSLQNSLVVGKPVLQPKSLVAAAAFIILLCTVMQGSGPSSGFAQLGASDPGSGNKSPSHGVNPQQFFPVSVWYSGGKARAPMLERITPDSPRLWKQDLLKIKQLGFNTVRTWVEWSVGEPREGEYHIENLDLILKLANEVGLRVIVQVYADSAPDWVGKKFPDGRYTAQDGQPIPSQAAPGYCIDH